jgi:hypothetical protein
MAAITTAGDRLQPTELAQTAKRRALALHSARLWSWKTVLIQSLGRELHALHIQQQERAFMATTHGLTYASRRREPKALH